ncbi:MAG: hypothetical protein GWP18_00705 [Proteobacteria bacterium]|nr:hypothetical protein [Pseudomonadota bacterium]
MKITYDRVLWGVPVGVAFAHTGTAARLVHNLKYKRSLPAGRILADAMAGRLPVDATSIVPVRRSAVRRVKYGIDQASFLAAAVGAIVDLPVIDAIAPPLWWPRRAGAPVQKRTAVDFHPRRDVADGVVFVDDVLTTGMTILSAARALQPARFSVLVATAAGTMTEGTNEVPKPGR